MSKLALAATFAAVMLSSFSVVPAQAQQVEQDYPCSTNQCDGGGTTAPEPQCGEQLGHLKRVFPAEVSGVGERHRVWITEFCPSSALMRSDGNAAYLRTAIAKNGVLTDVLQSRGYHADDVFAVKMMGDDTISLFVHRFDRR